jgi:predicted Na+-dependent transporter
MELIVMILAPFPLGYLIRHRIVAFVAYTAVHAFVFTFQSLVLVVDWAGGSESAFGPFPDGQTSQVYAYGVVNLVIYAVGLGLVHLGHRVGSRRRADAGVHLEPAVTR